MFDTFACRLNKVGGYCLWSDTDMMPVDGCGRQMSFIGHFIGSRDVELGDVGTVSIFFSPFTGETKGFLRYS
jgi:hypothetical protein